MVNQIKESKDMNVMNVVGTFMNVQSTTNTQKKENYSP